MLTNLEKAHALVELGFTVVPFEVMPNGSKRPVGGFKWSEIKIDAEHANLVDTYWGYGRDPQPLVAWYHPTIGATDVDIDTKTGKNGYVTMDRAGLELPETPVWYDTPRGGRHYVMRFPIGTTEAAPVKWQGRDIEGIDRRVANGLAIWYGDVPTAEELADIPDAPDWMCEGKSGSLDAPIVMDAVNARELLNGMPQGEIAPELTRILETLVPGRIDHRAMLNAQYAIAAEGLRGHQGAPDALQKLQEMYLAGEWNTPEYQQEWVNGLKGLETKVPEIMSKIKADAPNNEQEEANRKELIRLNAQEFAKEQKRKERYQGIEVCNWDELENTTIEWVIDGIWYFDSLNALVGRSQIGKTFVAASMTGSVAMGIDWFGHKVTQGRVLYIAGEGFAGIAKRFKAWCVQNKQDWAVFKERVTIIRRADLMSEMSVEDIRKLANDIDPVMIIVDTLSATSSIENENDAAEMRDLLIKIASIYPIAAKIAVHHPNDATRNSQKPKARGSGAFKSNADNLMTVTVDESFEPDEKVIDAAGPRVRFLTLSTDDNDYEGKSKESEPVTIKGIYLRESDDGVALGMADGEKKHPEHGLVQQVMEYLNNRGIKCTASTFYDAADVIGLKDAGESGWKTKANAGRILKRAAMRSQVSETKSGQELIYTLQKEISMVYPSGISI